MRVLGAVRGRRPGAGAGPLFLHQLGEAVVIDRQALLGEQLLGQVVREAVGVVQLEGVFGVDPGGLGLARFGDQALQHLCPRTSVRPKLSSSSFTQRAMFSRSATSSG